MVGDGRNFTSASSRWNKFEQLNGAVIGNLKTIARGIAMDDMLSREEKNEKLERLRKCAVDIHLVGVEARARSSSLSKLGQEIDRHSNENANIMPELLQSMHHQGSSAAKSAADAAANNPGNHAAQISQYIRNTTGDDEGDIQEDITTLQPREIRCPILNRVIDNPHVNTSCNHVYSLEGAIQLLYQSNGAAKAKLPESLDQVPSNFFARCPTAGCNGSFSRSSLQKNYELEITQRLHSMAGRRQSTEVQNLMHSS